LVINKIDLAPYVGASLAVMERDSSKMRGPRPFLFTNLRDGIGLDAVVAWLEEKLAASSDGRRKLLDVHSPVSAHGHHQDQGHPHHH